MISQFLMNIDYIQGLLYLVGGLIVFSVSRIARKGYRVTRSPTLLRITVSFIFLTLGLSLNGLAYFMGSVDFKLNFLGISLAFSSLLFIVAALLEVTGYFILALGHGIKSFQNRSFIPAFPVLFGFISTVSLLSLIKSLSFVFLIYGAFETLLSYLETKYKPILFMFSALFLLALGELIRWLAIFYTGLNPLMITSILLKLFGFIMLYTPVMQFTTEKGD
uniref:Uncharacterized protein n=1 Tax=uncultured marine crenarchaeote KM3-153-F8 TaxID=526665 RepID=B3V638_9ARCH|nr:hypothetical protein [uncultured marine crenarchaeote KM3-153-F8]